MRLHLRVHAATIQPRVKKRVMESNKGRIAKACEEMKVLYGMPEAKVKAALKRLLRLYGNEWGFIEENNYSVLFDCTVEDKQEGNKTVESKTRGSLIREGKKSEFKVLEVCSEDEPEKPEPLLKRRSRNHSEQPSSSIDKTKRSTILAQLNEAKEVAQLSLSKKARTSYSKITGYIKENKPAIAETSGGKEIVIDHNRTGFFKQKNMLGMHPNHEPHQEEFSLAVIHPEASVSDSSQLELVSCDSGEVKISLVLNSFIKYFAKIPSLDAVLDMIDDKFRKRYGIIKPEFSMKKLMREFCECVLAMSTVPSDEVHLLSMFEISKKSDAEVHTNGKDHHLINSKNLPCCSQVSINSQSQHIADDCNGKAVQSASEKKIGATDEGKSSNSCSYVTKKPNFVEDITRGEERQPISLVNDNGALKLPKFFYISKNIVYNTAYVNFSLARISDHNCCSNCFGNCLSAPANCACTGETRGDFAYTPAGLVEEKFLNECIEMSRRRVSKDHLFYCENCPLENSMGKSSKQQKRKRAVKPCKGHLMRKFIKECWAKCGCNWNCGNRVVQRGITVKLQVFQTPQGKGWGLRTLQVLEKGTFVCEYVGEIVTNLELYERNEQSAGEEHTYPVLLDADWASERHLKDEEALCLDATKFGNVARFINHRCSDANLVEIPVEVETPDHHYYHIAFFTSRKVEVNEELNWDYGIDFDDDTHPIKAFNCKCGSLFCCMKDRS